jgi:hypothetical protein
MPPVIAIAAASDPQSPLVFALEKGCLAEKRTFLLRRVNDRQGC